MKAISKLSVLVAILALAGLAHGSNAEAAVGVTAFDFDIAQQNGAPETEAGAHPYEVTTTVAFATHEEEGKVFPDGNARNISVDLPRGMVGNPTGVPTCPEARLENDGNCPAGSQVGTTTLVAPAMELPPLQFPIFNLETPPGVPAAFGFWAINVPVHMNASLLTGEGYGLRVSLVDLPQSNPWTESIVTFWGVPSDPGHDAMRGDARFGGCLSWFGPTGGNCKSEAPSTPFLSNPTGCSPALSATLHINSWQDPEFTTIPKAMESGGQPVGIKGCDRPPFAPKLSVIPSASGVAEPSSVNVRLEVPQQATNPSGRETAHVKDVEVSLPSGMTLNPAAADGLVGCSQSQINLAAPAPPNCPLASKIGTVRLETPLLDDPLEGGVYLSTQGNNPFGSLLAVYIAIADPDTGIVLKLPGRIVADPQTGQLVTTFPDNPQLPFEKLELSFKGGSRAPLVTPPACGKYEAAARLTSWSRPTETVAASSRFSVTANCGSAAGFTPAIEAGTSDPLGGKFSPFTLRVTRPDGQQNIAKIQATLPEGLLAKLAGVPLCEGAAAATGACPAGSQVGKLIVGAGSGSNPLYLPEAGKAPTAAYLAGPYHGAPYSLVVKVPAQAGPFDLGTVAVRNALNVDPVTTQVTAISDPLPQILQGIPIAYRDVRVEVNRPQFTLNPTNCSRQKVTSTLTSATGQSASPSASFAASGCKELDFAPQLSLKVKGATKRGKYPALSATLKAAKGQANIAKAAVTLPHSEFLAQEHIGTVCTRVQYAADACPKASVYGTARATTPLLDKPLTGPVYLRSSSNPLPDLVMALKGPIDVDLVGRIDSVNGGIRTTFASVPDAPVTKFTLNMQGGKKGLLVNSRNLCAGANKATVVLDGQNGKVHDFNPVVTNDCKAKPRKHKAKSRRHRLY